ncbi:four helix bundle protein [Fibrella forsythiae]|uniref:Four helix bundle protein n=1 Tax=Fibrella forsythiae TaxID=2817061 RepID=A0ABS3JK45_9BACT|nr:four helix bundle protein [Fibrella forsythiae]MBO0950377.1 four helix bundle protein [Fibrella forsythiae]
MATIHRFEELNAWKKARELAKAILDVTGQKSFSADYDLVRQIKRASGSVRDNVAEGFGRGGRAEFSQFLGIAKGSACEVKSQLCRALDSGYLSEDSFQSLYTLADETAKIIDGSIIYLNKTEVKGRRYAHEPKAVYRIQPNETEDCKQQTVN